MIVYTYIEYNSVVSIVYWYAMGSGFVNGTSVLRTSNSLWGKDCVSLALAY